MRISSVDPGASNTRPTGLRRNVAELLAKLVKTSGSVPEFSGQTQIKAGLRICAGDACVDGTRCGLLRSRSRIEGIMLAKLNDCRKKHLAGTENDDSQ